MAETVVSNKEWFDLSDPGTVEALQKILNQLPEMADRIEKINKAASFAETLVKDEETLHKVNLFLDHSNLDIKTIAAVIRLLEKLPFLAELADKIENQARFIESVLKDEQSQGYLQRNMEEYLSHATDKWSEGKQLWEQVKKDAEGNEKQITIFTIMKWMKEPQVQRFLSYVQALIHAFPSRDNGKEV